MIIEQAVLNRLISNTTLVSTRIYYVKAPQDVTKPYMTIQKISAVRDYSYSGEAILATRIQISIFATTYASCKAIAAEIQTAFSGYKGTMGGTGGVYVSACFYDDETDIGFDDQLDLYGLAIDLRLIHSE